MKNHTDANPHSRSLFRDSIQSAATRRLGMDRGVSTVKQIAELRRARPPRSKTFGVWTWLCTAFFNPTRLFFDTDHSERSTNANRVRPDTRVAGLRKPEETFHSPSSPGTCNRGPVDEVPTPLFVPMYTTLALHATWSAGCETARLDCQLTSCHPQTSQRLGSLDHFSME